MSGKQSGDNPRVASLPVTEFRNCSLVPDLGLCKLQPGPADEGEMRQWLAMIVRLAGKPAADNAASTECSVQDIRQSGANWRRVSQPGVFPFYIESVAAVEDLADTQYDVPVVRPFPGTFLVRASVFQADHDDYFQKNQEQWAQWVKAHQEESSYTGGLSVNLLEVPAEALRSGAADVRPLVLHALSPDGRGVDRGDAAAQAAIANAFWQTFWATGATRTERGSVFPVAFLPVDRSSAFEFAEPFHERYVSLRRRLFGRSAIVSYALEALTKASALVFCVESNQFKVSADFDAAAATVTPADVLLAVGELNRTGFIDAYTGANGDRFSAWAAQEQTGVPGEPWPYDDPARRGKIKAAGHGVSDGLQAIRAASGDAEKFVRIHRVVPFSGCAFLYEVMAETERLRQRGKIQNLDGELIGGTNSTFFLNFPEEYSALHSAMNEPVALLVENGQTRQIRTFRRAAFVLSKTGEAFITTRAGNHLQSDVLVFEGESAATNYFEKAHKSFRENQFGPLFFGAAVVGDSIVETFEDIPTEVPPAGWLTGDSEAFGGRIQPEHVVRVQVRQQGELKEVDVRHAFAVGPLLLDQGEIVPLGESREEFCSLKANAMATFDESSQLSRTELPEALLNCEARGVPPTRFPYDWNVTRAPRSAIGIREDGSVVIAVVDGRADVSHSVGATLAELAVIMQGLGCVQAMNMDGGGSSVMFIPDEKAVAAKLSPSLRDGVVSLPSDLGGVERLLPVPLVVVKK